MFWWYHEKVRKSHENIRFSYFLTRFFKYFLMISWEILTFSWDFITFSWYHQNVTKAGDWSNHQKPNSSLNIINNENCPKCYKIFKIEFQYIFEHNNFAQNWTSNLPKKIKKFANTGEFVPPLEHWCCVEKRTPFTSLAKPS